MNNLLRTLTESKAKASYPDCDLRLLLTTVKDGRVSATCFPVPCSSEARAQRQAHDPKLTDPFYDSLEGLLLELRTTTIDNHDAEAFLKPVSKAEVPDYYDVITNPMDLQTMLRKVKQKQYKSKREFKDDLDLIWSNCLTYNATESHPLRQCAIRLQTKANRLLRNLTDRKERADPVIPASLGGGGPPGPTSLAAKPNGVVNGATHRPPTITIKPRKSFSSDPPRRASNIGGAIVGKSERPQPFTEMPALVRTAEGMRAFAEADVAADGNPSALRGYLPADIDSAVKVEEDEDDAFAAMDGTLGDKRRCRSGSDGRARKRLRADADPHLWWTAVHADALLPNGLPHIAYPSSRAARPPAEAAPPRARPRRRTKAKARDADPDKAGEKTLLARMNANIRTMRRLRHTHARFAALGLGTAAAAPDEFDAPGAMPPPLAPADAPPETVPLAEPGARGEEDAVVGENDVDDRPWGVEVGIGASPGRRRRRRTKAQATAAPVEEPEEIVIAAETAEKCMRWMSEKVLEHEGFQGTSKSALDVLASVTSEYLLNVGRTIRFLCDKYSHTMTPEEIILHTLFESGISRVQDLERYISDDVERYGSRLGDLEKKLIGAYREVTAVDVLDDEALFDDDEEEGGALTLGDFADALGEDYLGLRELGIAAEFGMSSLSIPKKLLRSKRRGLGAGGAGHIAPAPPPLPYPLPAPFVPLTRAKVESQIGLLQPYYINRFTAVAAAAAPPRLPVPPPLPGPMGLPPLPGPSLPGLALATLPGPLAPAPAPAPAIATAMPPPPPPLLPLPLPPPPVAPPEVLPGLELPDDAPTPLQTKMGPVGQILLARAGTKKKVAVPSGATPGADPGAGGGPASGGAGTGAVGDAKKKKPAPAATAAAAATGMAMGNGRKKNGAKGAGVGGKGDSALMPPPPVPVPAPIMAAGV
ncbi:hypothetical protein GGX14DRAFT_518637 [Mycena pura]|uniref:Bromo domain-containing protein n=1 Tax=Mycena pura TaxID=153505 RepID=A0AAD6VNT2_9AGAR|nr:hypothetical protein GGX14DRAFT_518637 [Mycena pura]